MTQFELDQRNKIIMIENSRIRKIIDDIDLIHYKSINEEAAEKRYQILLNENKKLQIKLNNIYDI